ncbi:PREDICTED: putative ribosome-binding factor A, mitochondrial isoform X2 [Bison bison bison]|uniref:Ribosome-binding factor A, mitochondrial isoform X2 n=1 Tax=Bison bison bison TaxID=43346 RepID=A0A6P3IQF8_BISBB|nr:PREDICTED: putative ribosome-binding factor A, mitochondrial isoform X2 [Bison bison bison]
MWAALRGRPGLHLGFLSGARGLHSSPVSCGKNLLKKFASKTKKKFWYEGPSLGSHLTHKSSQLEFLTKSTSRRTRKEDQVSLTSDFSACRVFWRATLSEAQNAHTEAVLRRSAAHMRHLLMSQQTLRNVPPIVFVQDKKYAAVMEVDRLLAIADFGPRGEKEDFVQSDFSDPEALDAASPSDTLSPAAHLNLCGIDHEALNKQILEYKRRREQGHGSASPLWPEHMADLRKQMRRRKAKPHVDDDLSPKNYLQGGE